MTAIASENNNCKKQKIDSDSEKSISKLEPLTSKEISEAVSSFRRILQFETVSSLAPSTGAYRDCALYIQSSLRSISCFTDDSVFFLPEAPAHSPVVVAVWKGIQPDLPVILLNSHYDVVPANEKDWTVKPFEGLLKDEKIYGRGSQDMKCVCIQYIEAIRKLCSQNYKPTRSIYLTFVPDEEVGGFGMAAFLSSSLYKNLPGIAVALDEGLASTTNQYSVFYGERLPWWITVTAKGNTGHGSRFIENTAVEQLMELMNKALAFRKSQKFLLHGGYEATKNHNCSHSRALANKSKRAIAANTGTAKLGDVTSLNITTIEAGVKVGDTYAYNCVPPEAKCSMDIRISPHVPPIEIKNMLTSWCQECSVKDDNSDNSANLSWEFLPGQGNKAMEHAITSMDDKINPWYDVFTKSMTNMGLEFIPEVFPAATDSRFLRALGIRALGFSPMRNSEILLHENDEYLLKDIFVEGVSVYVGLIKDLASQAKKDDEQ